MKLKWMGLLALGMLGTVAVGERKCEAKSDTSEALADYHRVNFDWTPGQSDIFNGHILRPNQQLAVCVTYAANTLIEVRASGQVGLVRPDVERSRSVQKSNTPPTKPSPFGSSCWTFAPFKSGEVWVEVSQKKRGPP